MTGQRKEKNIPLMHGAEEISSNKILTLDFNDPQDGDRILSLGRALHIKDRVDILHCIARRPMSLLELTQVTGLPLSSVANHVNALADAGLIYIAYQPSKKGHIKVCHKALAGISIGFEDEASPANEARQKTVEMPVGLYSEANVVGPCGLAGKERVLVPVDDPTAFFLPQRVEAELVWFSWGYLTYDFPIHGIQLSHLKSLSFSLELCSETVYYRMIWPSDITFEVNGVEVATITSPGDFGGRRGALTPAYWGDNSTQYGLLRKISIRPDGVYVDDVLSDPSLRLSDLRLGDFPSIRLSIRIKEDAVHRGGINIFGKNFGDYPQTILMQTIEE